MRDLGAIPPPKCSIFRRASFFVKVPQRQPLVIYAIFISFRIHVPKIGSSPKCFSHPTRPPGRPSGHPKYKFRLPKYKSRHPKYKSRHSKYKSRHPKHESRQPKYKSRHPKYKSRHPKYDPRHSQYKFRHSKSKFKTASMSSKPKIQVTNFR